MEKVRYKFLIVIIVIEIIEKIKGVATGDPLLEKN